jgi:hypothetical protein
MPSKTKSQDIEIRITLAGPDAPERLLANAELAFGSGLLEGLRLTGFALWKTKEEKGESFVSVTFPPGPWARAVSTSTCVRFLATPRT